METDYQRIAITGTFTQPCITTVEQLRAATDRILARPTEDPTINLLVRAINREHAHMQELARYATAQGRDSYAQSVQVSMDRTWIVLQFAVAQANGAGVSCADCGHVIERPTDAVVCWTGDDNRDVREILHAHADRCLDAAMEAA